jgi:hypothetical protein
MFATNIFLSLLCYLTDPSCIDIMDPIDNSYITHALRVEWEKKINI